MSDHRSKLQSLGKSIKSLKNIFSPSSASKNPPPSRLQRASSSELKIPSLTPEIVQFVLQHRVQLLEFAKKKLFAEQVEFLIEVDAFEKLKTDSERLEKFKFIFTQYLDRNSATAVNISERAFTGLKEIKEQLDSGAATSVSANVFDQSPPTGGQSAKSEIAKMIRDNLTTGPRAEEFAAAISGNISAAAKMYKRSKSRRRGGAAPAMVELTGSIYGAHVFRSYSNPDISFAMVDQKRCNQNKFRIRFMHGRWQFEHAYARIVKGKVVYSGRWFQSIDASSVAEFGRIEQGKRLIIPLKNFESDMHMPRDVEIVLHLTPKGLKKIQEFFRAFKA